MRIRTGASLGENRAHPATSSSLRGSARAIEESFAAGPDADSACALTCKLARQDWILGKRGGTVENMGGSKSTFLIAARSLLVAVASDCTALANTDPIEPLNPIVIPDGIAHLIGLTATIKVTNASETPAHRFLFRVTVPSSDLPHQRVLMPALSGAVLNRHKNGTDHYLEIDLDVPPSGAVTRDARFLVLLLPADYLRTKPSDGGPRPAPSDYRRPSRLVESDAPEVRGVADRLFAGKGSPLEKARIAYEYPAKHLKFKPQSPAGAVNALITGSGDCTEFAALFCALCRAGGIAARMTAIFNLGTEREITVSQPNHNAAEVFLAGPGWVPVDPNLGGGKYDRPIGFGRTGNSTVLLSREGAWIWSTWLPPDGFAAGSPPPTMTAGLSWHMTVVDEGAPSKMLASFEKHKAESGGAP